MQKWTLNIHIDYRALIDPPILLHSCLSGTFINHFECQIVDINKDKIHEYDGARSLNEECKTLVGREVRIFLPASSSDHPEKTYRDLILELWKKLQDMNIPLLHINLPGEKSIMIEDTDLPSPFSFRSNPDDRPTEVNEDSILFPKFKPYDNKHPILDVHISTADLNAHHISIAQSTSNSRDFYHEHQRQVNAHIQSQLAKIDQQKNFKEFLNDSQFTKKMCLLAKRTRFQANEDIKKLLNEDPTYQRLIEAYPSCFDVQSAEFVQEKSINDIIKELADPSITNFNIKRKIDHLRELHDELVKAIKSKFKARNIKFEGYDLDALIEKNPRAMDCIYRNTCLIQQEIDANQILNEDPSIAILKKSQKSIISELNQYRTERMKIQAEYYYPFLSQLFGGWSRQTKLAAVDALIEHIKNKEKIIDPIHFGPLQQGNLGNLVRTFGIELNTFPQQILNKY